MIYMRVMGKSKYMSEWLAVWKRGMKERNTGEMKYMQQREREREREECDSE